MMPSCSIRVQPLNMNKFVFLSALLLIGALNCVHARNLRRINSNSSSGSSLTIDNRVNQEHRLESTSSVALQSFEIVGAPIQHNPFIAKESIHRSTMQREVAQVLVKEEDADPENYNSNDESLVIHADPGNEDYDDDPHHHHHQQQQQQRLEQSCASDEMLWLFKINTDSNGSETSWKLEQHSSGGHLKIKSGPQSGTKYRANTTYRASACLSGVKMYRLTVLNTGEGMYTYSVGGVTEYSSSQTKTSTDDDVAVRDFYVGLSAPAPITGRSSACNDGEQQIGIRIKTDMYGAENSWELRSLTTGKVVKSAAAGTYADGASRTDTVDVCVPYGTYRFTLTDGTGDGICCENGSGKYMLYLDGELMVNGSDFAFGKKVQHTIVVGYDNTHLSNQMSIREIQYLNGHNWRRKMYHEKFGSTFVPLKYDLSLAEDAQYWANQLLTDCDTQGIDHMPGQEQGENLAKNVGFDYESGQLYPVENICRRWFEREENWSFPRNAHFTQGLWRSSRYMGCAESTKLMEDGRTCRVQVCRYARAGNCNMGQFDAHVGDNWKIPMLDDNNKCGPACPPNGCH